MKLSIRVMLTALLAACLVAGGCGRRKAATSDTADMPSYRDIAQVRLTGPIDAQAAAYLGVEPGQTAELARVKGSLLLVQVFDMYCALCQAQAGEVNRLYELARSPELANNVVFVGIGKKNTKTETEIYRDRFSVPFPLFPDPDNENVPRFGKDVHTPSFFIIDLKRKKVLHSQWKIESAEQLVEKLKAGLK